MSEHTSRRWPATVGFLLVTGIITQGLVMYGSDLRAWLCDSTCPDDTAGVEPSPTATAGNEPMTSSPDRDADALFQQILEHPELDEPRWAYAEAIRATEPERAEFIELELELAAMTRRERGKSENVSKKMRRDWLLEKHFEDWIPPLGVERIDFHRGFITEVWLPADDFVERHAKLLSQAPIQHLILTRPATNFDAFLDLEALVQIRSLSFEGHDLDDQHVEHLLASSHVSALRWLDLENNHLTRRASELLVETDNLPFIKFISLRDNPFAPELDYWLDQGVIIDAEPNADMKDLEAEYGEIEWLRHYGGVPSRFDYSTEASVPMQAPASGD